MSREWRLKNPERAREYNKQWRANNKERVAATNKRWRANNPGRVKEQNRRWRSNNPERARDDSKRWRLAHPGRGSELSVSWQKRNPEKVRQSKRAEYRRHRERYIEHSRRHALKKQYGITLEDYGRVLADQGGGCAVCGERPKKFRLAVDHDHTTGVVRGLLCVKCNTTIGKMETLEWLVCALTYLRRHNAACINEMGGLDAEGQPHCGHYRDTLDDAPEG